jgi:hypothetical protein
MRHEDFRFGFHGAEGVGVGEALGFFAVDADYFFEVPGNVLDVAF